jgi:hypothetical protein
MIGEEHTRFVEGISKKKTQLRTLRFYIDANASVLVAGWGWSQAASTNYCTTSTKTNCSSCFPVPSSFPFLLGTYV